MLEDLFVQINFNWDELVNKIFLKKTIDRARHVPASTSPLDRLKPQAKQITRRQNQHGAIVLAWTMALQSVSKGSIQWFPASHRVDPRNSSCYFLPRGVQLERAQRQSSADVDCSFQLPRLLESSNVSDTEQSPLKRWVTLLLTMLLPCVACQ